MNKFLFIFFIVVFGLYIPFSRHPDFFDGVKAPAVIHYRSDSISGKKIPFADFTLNDQHIYSVKAGYLFRSLAEGDKRTVIYENAEPEKGAVYSWWGYWITWKELLGCLVGYFVLFQAAKSIVSSPSAESIKELEDHANKPKVKKSKYR